MTAVSMTYLAARPLIKNGDIVHVYRPEKNEGLTIIAHSIISFFTGSRIYHNVVAMWMSAPSGELRLMAVESNIKGGKRIIPLSIYETHKLEVQPLAPHADFSLMEPVLMKKVGQAPYSMMDFAAIGAREYFGYQSKPHGGGQVCSELCAEALIAGGVPLNTTLMSPGKLRAELIILGVEPTILIDILPTPPAPL